MNIHALISEHVRTNLTTLIFGLVGGDHDASGAVNVGKPVAAMIETALELAAPVLDYEEAAREAGWRPACKHHPACGGACFYLAHDFSNHPTAATWKQLCEAEDIEPHEREVFEHWAVSDWLAERLTAKGERVANLAGLNVWARVARQSRPPLVQDSALLAIAAAAERKSKRRNNPETLHP